MQQPVAEAGVDRVPILRVLATAIVVRQNRGLNVPKMLWLKEIFTNMGWLETSFLTVQLLADGTYLLVDGLHRLKAVLDLISVNSLPADYTVPCLVLSDTPANVLQNFTRGYDADAKRELFHEGVAARKRRNEGYKFINLYTYIYICVRVGTSTSSFHQNGSEAADAGSRSCRCGKIKVILLGEEDFGEES